MSTIAAKPIRLALDLLVPSTFVLMERSTDRSALAAFAFSFCSGDSIESLGCSLLPVRVLTAWLNSSSAPGDCTNIALRASTSAFSSDLLLLSFARARARLATSLSVGCTLIGAPRFFSTASCSSSLSLYCSMRFTGGSSLCCVQLCVYV